MYNLVWKEQSTKRWIITTADTYGEIFQGQGENRPEWFSTRREALLFIEANLPSYKINIFGRTVLRPARTYVYRRANHSYGVPSIQRFNWSTNWNYLEGGK